MTYIYIYSSRTVISFVGQGEVVILLLKVPFVFNKKYFRLGCVLRRPALVSCCMP